MTVPGQPLAPLRARQEHLDALHEVVGGARHRPELVVLSGPRRVGKTFLLQHLLSQLPAGEASYFEATQSSESDQLRRFHRGLVAALGPEAPPGPGFASWEHALEACAYVARRRPLTVVMDEVTYLMGSTPGFTSIVQAFWDGLASLAGGPSLSLILAGSAVGLIEDALGARGSLYQRPTRVIRLQPLTVAEAHRFAGRPDPVALFEAYAACGGYPLHLDSWDFGLSADDNLETLAASPGSLLLEDGQAALAGLPDSHRRVLLAVGHGCAKRSEIVNEVGTSSVDRSVESLVRSGLIRAVTPIGAPLRARPVYRVTDPFLRFWIRLLSDHVQRIEAGQGRAVLDHTAGEWATQLGVVFEQAAREHAARLVTAGTLPSGTLVDEWWTTSGEQVQVDVLGLNRHATVAVGEARWQREPLGQREADGLAGALRHVPKPVASPTLLLYGRGGVRPEVVTDRVLGFGPADMVQT